MDRQIGGRTAKGMKLGGGCKTGENVGKGEKKVKDDEILAMQGVI